MDHTTNTNDRLSTETTAQNLNDCGGTAESTQKAKCWESQDLRLIRRKRLRTAQRVAAAVVSGTTARAVQTTSR